MADLLGLSTTLVKGILSRVKEVKTNEEECKLLASLAEKTLPLLEMLHAKELSDPSVTNAIELVHEALKDTDKAVEDCYKAAFFSALMHPDIYSIPLKHAAERLDHAISQIPLVSISMVAEIQSDMAALYDQLRQAKPNDKASMADQTRALNKELDGAFQRSIQDSDEVKKLIRELMQEHSSSNYELRIELAKLQTNASEARMAKEKQQEFELNQIIAVLSESLGEGSMIYDRSSIEEWLKRGHHRDPLTNIELISGDLFPCQALQSTCQCLLEESGASSSIVDKSQIEESKPTMMVNGLYEGHGKLKIGSKSFMHLKFSALNLVDWHWDVVFTS